MKTNKVGIFTFYNNNNYGSYLQAFALKSKISSIGYDAYIIDFSDVSKPWNKALRKKVIYNRLVCSLKHPQLFWEAIMAKRIGKNSTECSPELSSKFHQFSETFLNIYKKDFVNDDFLAFVVGSDQVWKVTLPGLHYVFFLRFAPSFKRISYAASLGANVIPSFNREEFKKYVSEFSSVAVREDSAVSLINNLLCENKAYHVLDPVLLVGEHFWENYINKLDYNVVEEYLLFYFLDSIEDKGACIQRITNRYPNTKILIVNTGVIYFSEDHSVSVVEPSPLEFVYLIKNSCAVLTDSFHGSAFSLLFHKEFYTFSRNYKMYSGQEDRLLSLFNLCRCPDRLIKKCEDIDNIQELDVCYIEERMKQERCNSVNYLEDSINKAARKNSSYV